MFYVIYVGAGRESAARNCIRKLGSEDGSLCGSCFYPVRHMRKKIRGKWTDYHERMIPGYVFVESGRIGELYAQLRRLPVFLKLLGKESEDDSVAFQALQPDEVRWLNGITGGCLEQGEIGEEPVAELSQVGFDENDQVKILSGPLTGMAGQIRKINLHRRIAEVEVGFMGRKILIHLGIELLDRKTDTVS